MVILVDFALGWDALSVALDGLLACSFRVAVGWVFRPLVIVVFWVSGFVGWALLVSCGFDSGVGLV